MTLRLYVATPEDVPAIMRLERLPEYEGLVGRWDHERHGAEMAMPSSRYLLSRAGGQEVDGFVLFQGLDDQNLRVHLKRAAVADAGHGLGTRLLSAAIDWLFTATDTNRLDLEVFVDNTRARRAYEKLGFLTEGVLRDWIRMSNGQFRTMVMMSLLRREWSGRGCAFPLCRAGDTSIRPRRCGNPRRRSAVSSTEHRAVAGRLQFGA